MSDVPLYAMFEVVAQSEIASVLAATREGRCVSCYGPVSRECESEHELYCCVCDDSDCADNQPQEGT